MQGEKKRTCQAIRVSCLERHSLGPPQRLSRRAVAAEVRGRCGARARSARRSAALLGAARDRCRRASNRSRAPLRIRAPSRRTTRCCARCLRLPVGLGDADGALRRRPAVSRCAMRRRRLVTRVSFRKCRSECRGSRSFTSPPSSARLRAGCRPAPERAGRAVGRRVIGRHESKPMGSSWRSPAGPAVHGILGGRMRRGGEHRAPAREGSRYTGRTFAQAVDRDRHRQPVAAAPTCRASRYLLDRAPARR